MNGRVYDPNLGRFLSVDPIFQFPTNTQSLNPYSYVMNNPLSLTDPSGYASINGWGWQTAGSVCIDGIGCIGGEGGRDANGNLIKKTLNGADNKQKANSAQTKPAGVATIGDPSTTAKKGQDDLPTDHALNCAGELLCGVVINLPTRTNGTVSLDALSNERDVIPVPSLTTLRSDVELEALLFNVPLRIAIATVETESKFRTNAINQNIDKNGKVTSTDYGLMQINSRNFGVSLLDEDGKQFAVDGYKVKTSYQYNVKVGMSILHAAYMWANKNAHNDIPAATYARYNAGGSALRYYRTPGTPVYKDVHNFMRYYNQLNSLP